MNEYSPPISLVGIEQTEEDCRRILRESPNNQSARVDLAWSLFVQAMHHAGQETLLASLDGDVQGVDSTECVVKARRDSISLLNECIRQSYIASGLSDEVANRLDVRTLHSLIDMSGAGTERRAAERNMARLLEALAHDLGSGPDVA